MHRPKNVNITFTPCSLRQPPRTDAYLVYLIGNYFATIQYSARHKMWNVSDNDDDTDTDLTKDVVAWAYITPIRKSLRHFVNKEDE